MEHSSPRGRPSSTLLLISSAAILLIACGKKAPDAPDAGTPSLASAASQDPCSLLEPREVEAALGGSLVGPPYRFKNEGNPYRPAADGGACRYESAGYHFIEIDVEWEGGAMQMKMYGTVGKLADQRLKGVLKLGDGSELTGAWEEAKVIGCCTFIAMRGDHLATVDIAASNATLKQAAAIADAALGRIEKPLPVDGATGVPAAIAREAQRPRERGPCGLVSRAEAEAALGTPLANDPVVDDNMCTYTFSGEVPLTIALTIRWRDSYSHLRHYDTAIAGLVEAEGSLGNNAGQDAPEPASPDPALSGPWETAYPSDSGFAAVNKDVLVIANASGGMKQENARKLVVAAMSKL